jgi:hypothetical protein
VEVTAPTDETGGTTAPQDVVSVRDGRHNGHVSLADEARADVAVATTTLSPPADVGQESTRREPPAEACSRLVVYCFGRAEIWFEGELIWPSRGRMGKTAGIELLLMLAAQGVRGARSGVLGLAFWPDRTLDDRQIAGNLRKRHLLLRRELAELVPGFTQDPVLVSRGTGVDSVYRLDDAVVWSDVHAFVELERETRSRPTADAVATYEAALALYRGELLDRSDVPNWPWLDEEPTSTRRADYIRAAAEMRQRLARQLAGGPVEHLVRAQELLAELVDDDPLDLELWELLLRSYGRRGDALGLEACARKLRLAWSELESDGTGTDTAELPPRLRAVLDGVRASIQAGTPAPVG